MRKVCILGRCSNTRQDAPIHSPDWEMWVLGWDPVPRYHRLFEIHSNWREFHGEGGEEARLHQLYLSQQDVPVYMLEKEPDIPTSVAYPFDDVARIVGRTAQGTPYLESSLAYMMGLAILELEPDDRIGLWGIDLQVNSEYSYQKPNMEYLIGLARGRGITVTVPPESSLLTHERGAPYGFPGWGATS